MKTITSSIRHGAVLALLIVGSTGLVACTAPGPVTPTADRSAATEQPQQPTKMKVGATSTDSDRPVLRKVQSRVTIPAGASSELLGEQGVAALEQLLEDISAWHSIERIEITGHTDSEGSDASNERFSLKRATAVADRLRALGIHADVDWVIAGKGEKFPVADNTSLAGRALNRRVEIAVQGRIDTTMAALPKQPGQLADPALATPAAQPGDLLQAANQ